MQGREKTFILELTEAECKELDSITYETASYERCKATVYGRDMDETIHSLRGKVIDLINKARKEWTRDEGIDNKPRELPEG